MINNSQVEINSHFDPVAKMKHQQIYIYCSINNNNSLYHATI